MCPAAAAMCRSPATQRGSSAATTTTVAATNAAAVTSDTRCPFQLLLALPVRLLRAANDFQVLTGGGSFPLPEVPRRRSGCIADWRAAVADTSSNSVTSWDRAVCVAAVIHNNTTRRRVFTSLAYRQQPIHFMTPQAV